MTKILTHNAVALLLALVLVAVAVLAALGVDVPAVLEYVATTLVGGAVVEQTPRAARRRAVES